VCSNFHTRPYCKRNPIVVIWKYSYNPNWAAARERSGRHIVNKNQSFIFLSGKSLNISTKFGDCWHILSVSFLTQSSVKMLQAVIVCTSCPQKSAIFGPSLFRTVISDSMAHISTINDYMHGKSTLLIAIQILEITQSLISKHRKTWARKRVKTLGLASRFDILKLTRYEYNYAQLHFKDFEPYTCHTVFEPDSDRPSSWCDPKESLWVFSWGRGNFFCWGSRAACDSELELDQGQLLQEKSKRVILEREMGLFFLTVKRGMRINFCNTFWAEFKNLIQQSWIFFNTRLTGTLFGSPLYPSREYWK